MPHLITMVTFTTQIPAGSGGTDGRRAFFGRQSVDFSQARLEQIEISDDDGGFHYIRNGASGFPVENQQSLVAETMIGDRLMAAGSQISSYHGSIIADSTGNRFIVMFPAEPVPMGGVPVEIGNRLSAFVISVPAPDENGQLVWPVFDPAGSFRQFGIGTHTPNANSPAVTYDPTLTRHPTDPWCFAKGTLIETRDGPRLIEELKTGDQVLTRDNGLQPVRWIGSTHLDGRRLDLQPHLRPIRICAGALGHGVPESDLVVSPQHRILIRSNIVSRMFDCAEVLVAAKHLLQIPGVTSDSPAAGVTYIHMMFDRHEIIRSAGAWTESFYAGPQVMKGIGAKQRQEIISLFPALLSGALPEAARKFPGGRESRQMAMRHAKNQRQLVVSDGR